jgi:MarR family transcriptional regulator, lower aerobic nicotinate degradation pathway regulator
MNADPADHIDENVPARLRTRPTRLLSLAAMRCDRLVNDGLARVDARKWHYAVLATLREIGPISQAELSRRTGIYHSDIVAVINELAGREFVERTPDPADRRRNVITVTEPGVRHLSTLDDLLAAIEDEALAPLNGEERAQLVDLLTRILANHR